MPPCLSSPSAATLLRCWYCCCRYLPLPIWHVLLWLLESYSHHKTLIGEVICCQLTRQCGHLGPPYSQGACKDLTEALVKVSFCESYKSRSNQGLVSQLILKSWAYLLCGIYEQHQLINYRVASYWPQDDHQKHRPLLEYTDGCLPADNGHNLLSL